MTFYWTDNSNVDPGLQQVGDHCHRDITEKVLLSPRNCTEELHGYEGLNQLTSDFKSIWVLPYSFIPSSYGSPLSSIMELKAVGSQEVSCLRYWLRPAWWPVFVPSIHILGLFDSNIDQKMWMSTLVPQNKKHRATETSLSSKPTHF